ncbi:helix-turn-helix transcriptional regulator [Thomasclavelia sp.]
MEWLNKMNNALQYIEENLENDIDYHKISQIACSSLQRFQNMFIFMTDITLSEYVRYRRMSLAAEELKNTNIKVIDLALKYGYESPEAFTRSFREFHGIPPTSVRKLKISKFYQPIFFKANINGGNLIMGTKPLVRMIELKDEKILVFQSSSEEPERDAWNMMRKWVVDHVAGYETRRYLGYAPMGHHPNGEENNNHLYYACMLLHEKEYLNMDIADTFIKNIPKGIFLVGDVVLNEFNKDGSIDIGSSMKNASQTIYEYMLEMGDYELDFSERPFLEEHIFPKEWFLVDEPEKISADYKFWLPIKKSLNKK